MTSCICTWSTSISWATTFTRSGRALPDEKRLQARVHRLRAQGTLPRQSSYSMCRIIGCGCPCSTDRRVLRSAAMRGMSVKYACATPQSSKQGYTQHLYKYTLQRISVRMLCVPQTADGGDTQDQFGLLLIRHRDIADLRQHRGIRLKKRSVESSIHHILVHRSLPRCVRVPNVGWKGDPSR